MGPIVRSTPARVFGRLALAAGSIAWLGLVACEPGDPLETIRQQQRSGDLSGSIEPLRELLAERPDDAEAHYLYGRALVLTQQRNLASWSLRRAMQDQDWLIPAGLQLAELSFGFGDFRQTEEVTSRILEHDPQNVAALLLRARALALDKKEPKRALADA